MARVQTSFGSFSFSRLDKSQSYSRLQYHLPETVFTILTSEFPEQESEGGQTENLTAYFNREMCRGLSQLMTWSLMTRDYQLKKVERSQLHL